MKTCQKHTAYSNHKSDKSQWSKTCFVHFAVQLIRRWVCHCTSHSYSSYHLVDMLHIASPTSGSRPRRYLLPKQIIRPYSSLLSLHYVHNKHIPWSCICPFTRYNSWFPLPVFLLFLAGPGVTVTHLLPQSLTAQLCWHLDDYGSEPE